METVLSNTWFEFLDKLMKLVQPICFIDQLLGIVYNQTVKATNIPDWSTVVASKPIKSGVRFYELVIGTHENIFWGFSIIGISTVPKFSKWNYWLGEGMVMSILNERCTKLGLV